MSKKITFRERLTRTGPPKKTTGIKRRLNVSMTDFSVEPNWDHIKLQVRLLRQRFIYEYLKDFQGADAVRRLGMGIGSPALRANEWLKEEYTQWFLAKQMQIIEENKIVTRNDVLFGLKREANNFSGEEGAAACRTRALVALSKVLGMQKIKIEADVNVMGGIAIIPMTANPDTWEETARQQQRQLVDVTKE